MSGRSLTIKARTISPWICASGRGSGQLFDAVPVKDSEGLPFIPGRHLKGLLRFAVERLPPTRLGAEDEPPTDGQVLASFLFGPASETGERDDLIGEAYFFGLLRVSSACLGQADRSMVLGLSLTERENALFMTSQSTAIERNSGQALGKSLRATQTAIPLTLYATIEALDHLDIASSQEEANARRTWPDVIARALPLVRAVGANRNRGFGRVVMTVDRGHA